LARPSVLIPDSTFLIFSYEPNAEISDDIDEEKDRVNFIRGVCMLFLSKARVKLNPKKLYQADGNAVQELLKAATMLYKAYTATGDEQEECEFYFPARF
jgi:clusterin-associated protein 1